MIGIVQFRIPLVRQVLELRRINKILAFDWKSQRSLLVTGVISLLVEIFARLLEPWPLKFIIDDVIDSIQSQPSSSSEATGLHYWILFGSLSFVLIAAIRAASQYMSTISLAVVGNRFLTELRGRTFDHIQSLPIHFHDRCRSGDLATRLVGDMGRLQEVGVTALLPLIVHSLTLVFMLIVMLFINPQLGLISFFIFPIFLLISLNSGSKIRSVSRQQRKREGKIGATSTEAISAIRTVQAMGLEEAMSENFGQQSQKSASQSVRGKRLSARLERCVDLLIALVTAVILWRGSILVIERVLTTGDLLVFLAYLKNAFKPMRDIAKYSGRISGAMASAERIVELLETPSQVVEKGSKLDPPKSIKLVRFENVSFSYHSHSETISNVSFTAKPGELIALVGPSGAGKSTLMNLLLRLYEPCHGSILFDHQNIRDFKLKELRKCIAIVPQETILFNTSVRDNILIGCEEISEAEITRAATLSGAHDFICSLKNGYDTIIGERGSTLSGGQQKRLAIARAAVRDAPILVLDEPMAGLDSYNKRLIKDALCNLRKDKIIFMISHDYESVCISDQIFMLRSGQIVDKGHPSQLLKDGGLFSQFMLTDRILN